MAESQPSLMVHAWMAQVARELSGFDGFLASKSYLLLDRDSKYTAQFRRILRDAGVTPLLLPASSPNLNAYAERFVRTIKEECLSRLILFGEGMLSRAIDNFMEHYHTERNHQGLGNKIIAPDHNVGEREGEVVCRERLGGLLKYYHRAA